MRAATWIKASGGRQPRGSVDGQEFSPGEDRSRVVPQVKGGLGSSPGAAEPPQGQCPNA
jgi:hypothetical protein